MVTSQVHLSAIIPDSLHQHRLDQVAAKLFSDYSRAKLQTWIKSGQLTVDGQAFRSKDKVNAGQCLTIDAALVEQTAWEAQSMPLHIIYEDDDILVLNKSAGVVVHPGAGNPDKTLVNALLHHAPGLNQLPRAGVVHRLDKDTSGLMVVAKTLKAHHRLVAALQKRRVKREYQAIVVGTLISGGTIDAPIGRHPKHRTKMAAVDHGKPAMTHYRIIKRFAKHTHIRVQLETGRTHQIRVHMAHLGYPLVGDRVYGGRTQALIDFPRQALHADRLGFEHPVSGEMIVWEVPLPEDMVQLLEHL